MGKICSKCHYENNDNAILCHSCGKLLADDKITKSISKMKKNSSKTLLIIVLILVIILSLFFIIKGEWIGVLLVLIVGIPLIIKLTIDALINKAGRLVWDKANDKYQEFKQKNKK